MAGSSPNRTLLLVEDDRVLSLGESVALGRYGYRVMRAFSGEEAIETCNHEAHEIDLILMDINLGPGMDGTEAAQVILSRHDIPVVFLTSQTDPSIVERTEAVSSYGYVVKSASLAVLNASIKMAFKLHEAHRTIRLSEDKYSKAFHISPDSININRLEDGVYTAINRGFTEILGYTSEDVLGRSSLDPQLQIWADPADRQRLVEGLKSQGEVQNLVARFRAKDGSCRMGMMSARVLEIDGVPSIISITRDVSERQRIEQTMRETEKLESIGVLAGGIAHDFNNLLAGLSGHLELAKLQLKNNKVEAALGRLEKASQVFERTKALTKQLLTFSKGGTPQRTLNAMGPLLKEWSEFALSGSDVFLELDLPDGLWPCECDSMQVAQLVDNLLINARQASPPGGTVRLRAENLRLGEPFLRIQVTDWGGGIPADVVRRIFTPFFTTKASGTGLGLATSRSIAHQHGGRLELEPQEGAGTTFTLLLPAVDDCQVSEHPSDDDWFQGQGTALIMDDDEALRDTVGEMLTSMGFEVTRARDGHDALAFCTKANRDGCPVALVVLDLTIPGGMGGIETSRQLRQSGCRAVHLAISGYSEESGKIVLGRDGFQGQLGKPFSRKDLSRMLARVFTPLESPARNAVG